MTASEFYRKWNSVFDNILEYDGELLDKLDIPENAKNFLKEFGMPDAAAPFLSFEVFEDTQSAELSYLYPGAAEYDSFIKLGSDGADLSVCIEKKNGRIFLIDTFENTDSVFINSSIFQFAESILAYSEFIGSTIEQNGEEAYLDSVTDEESLSTLAESLRNIDEKALIGGSFWENELSEYSTETE